MSRNSGVLLFALVAAISTPFPPSAAISSAAILPGLEFISPLPGSAQIPPGTSLIIRPGGILDPTSVGAGLLRVLGSSSGIHEGPLRLSDDLRTLTFQPDLPFAFGEQVIVALGAGLRTDHGEAVPPAWSSFSTSGPEREAILYLPGAAESDDEPPPQAGGPGSANVIRVDSLPSTTGEPLPPDFPHVQATVFGPPTPGRLFLSSITLGSVKTPSFLMILENDGTPFFQRKIDTQAIDFKMQPDGRLTYFDRTAKAFYALDTRFAVVDSFRCGNGYVTDGHDLVLLPNGHALLMSYDPELVDLSPLKTGLGFGIAVGLIIQELDQRRNVVFQWRSWDHFKITDSIGRVTSGGGIDYVHGNSIDADPDGNIIISCRHMSEVTKISRSTGEILWRLGGKNNQFTFINDPFAISRQHAVKLLPNGNLVMFDNGNFRLPSFSRAVEYAIDETQKTATLVWQYRLSPDAFGPAFGYVQRFPNGNTLINWGNTTPTLTEVAPDGSIVSELTFDPGIATYRAFRFDWPPPRPAEVTFKPAVINKGAIAGPLLAVIEPVGSNFSAADVLLPTVRLDGTLRADAAMVIQPPDANGDGIPDVTVQFPRVAVDRFLSIGMNRLEVTGSLRDGTVFRGSAELRALAPDGAQTTPGSLQLVSVPGALPVEIGAAGGPARPRTFAVYDIQGRLVKRWQTRGGAGDRASWDGRRADGRRVGSGIYLLRAEDGLPGPAVKVLIAR